MEFFLETRKKTVDICRSLKNEDYCTQAIEDVSPPKWHLAHTSWFFETFILIPYAKNYRIFNPHFHYLYNSYYQGIGKPYPRAKRGLQLRPTVEETLKYRQHVDESILNLLNQGSNPTLKNLMMVGIHHEQQHQELLLTDIKYNYAQDVHMPHYRKKAFPVASHLKFKTNELPSKNLSFTQFEGGLIEIGHDGQTFCFDNELPKHETYLKPFAIADRLITNGEYLEFIEAKGYQESHWWLADGWDLIRKESWEAPLYWVKKEDSWYEYTLNGLIELNHNLPVTHISFYEAEAFARFKNCRLLREAEWEYAACKQKLTATDNLLEADVLHPIMPKENSKQFLGDAWEWTQSAYLPYPGYEPLKGALGEYNGKFMSNQMVIRGGSCVTPRSHIRTSYRNFFQPDKRWQFTGIRLAKDAIAQK